MRRLTFLLLLILQIQPFSAQSECYLSSSINPTPKIQEIFECWKGYLSSRPDSLYDNPYWNSEDKKKYRSYDLLRSEGFLSPSLYGLYVKYNYKNIVYGIEPKGDEYVIHSLVYSPLEKDQFYPLAMIRVIAKRDTDGKFKLHNWVHHHTRNWNYRKVGIIQYIYHPGHPFNTYKAEQANQFVEMLNKAFDLNINQIEYYISVNADEISKLKGFEYLTGMYESENNLGGYTDRINNIIYSNSISGEFYEHELMRLINSSFPEASGVFINGLAVYYQAAPLGLPILLHFQKMNSYLKEHPEIDLTDSNGFGNLDNITASHYYLGAAVCHLCLKKGGLPLLKEGMQAGEEDRFYQFTEKRLGMKKKDLNLAIRKQIAEFAEKGFTPLELK